MKDGNKDQEEHEAKKIIEDLICIKAPNFCNIEINNRMFFVNMHGNGILLHYYLSIIRNVIQSYERYTIMLDETDSKIPYYSLLHKWILTLHEGDNIVLSPLLLNEKHRIILLNRPIKNIEELKIIIDLEK